MPRRSASPRRIVAWLGAAALVATLLVGGAGVVQAQSSSPAPGSAAPAISFDILYLQTFATSQVTPDGEDVTVLASRASGQTMYIEGLEERRFGTVPTAEFLLDLSASLASPPYAAVLGTRADGSQVLVVGQVLEGLQVDPQSFQYRLRLVPDEVDIDLAVDAERLETVTEPLDLQLTYVLFTGVEGCPPWQSPC
jgi:hypothetical protein